MHSKNNATYIVINKCQRFTKTNRNFIFADRKIVDRWVKTHDKPSFLMARRLIKEEGLLCGGSSGTAVYAACEVTSLNCLVYDRYTGDVVMIVRVSDGSDAKHRSRLPAAKHHV